MSNLLKQLLTASESIDGADRTAKMSSPPVMDIARDVVPELKRFCETLTGTRHVFNVGDIIQWKKGRKEIRNRYSGGPFVVIDVFEPYQCRDESSRYRGEFIDLYLACMTADGEIFEWAAPSMRFEPWTGETK